MWKSQFRGCHCRLARQCGKHCWTSQQCTHYFSPVKAIGIIHGGPGPEGIHLFIADADAHFCPVLFGRRLGRALTANTNSTLAAQAPAMARTAGQWLCPRSTRLPSAAVNSVAASGSAGIKIKSVRISDIAHGA